VGAWLLSLFHRFQQDLADSLGYELVLSGGQHPDGDVQGGLPGVSGTDLDAGIPSKLLKMFTNIELS